MATREEMVLELEARGELPADKQEMLDELRARGGVMSKQEYAVRSGKDRPDYRPEPLLGDSFQRFSDLVMDPFGVQDEMVGIGQGVRAFFQGGGQVTPENWARISDAYTKAAERVRAEKEVGRKDYGFVPEVVGALGLGGAVASGARAVAAPFGARVISAAKTGAGMGAAAGFGHSEGGIAERAIGAGYGAGAGALVGPVASEIVAPGIAAAIRGVRHGARTTAEKITDTFGDVIPTLRRSADDRFVRALKRQNMTVDDAAAEYEARLAAGKFGKTQTDVPVTMADLGPAMQRQGRAIATIPGRGSAMAEEVYSARQAGQFNRMDDYLRRSLSVSRDDYTKTGERLVREMKEAATPAYRKFYDLKDGAGRPVRYDVGPILRKSEMRDAQLSPALQKVMSRARAQFMHRNTVRDMGRDANAEVMLGRDAIMGSSPTYKLTGERFDSAKQALDDMIEAAKGNNERRLLTGLKNDLVAYVDKESQRQAVKTRSTVAFDAKGNKTRTAWDEAQVDAKGKPVYESLYAKARDAYGTPASLKSALSQGRSFMKGEADMTGAAYRALSTAEKRMFRLGVAREARRVMGRKQIGQDMIGEFRKPNVQDVLEEVMTPKKYRQFMALVEGEKGMAGTNTIVRGGSPTANKLADVEDLNAFMTVGRVLKDKGLAGAAFDAVGTAIQKTLGMREVDAHNLARLMFETDQAKVRATLGRLKLLYGNGRVEKGVGLIGDQVHSIMQGLSIVAGQNVAVEPARY